MGLEDFILLERNFLEAASGRFGFVVGFCLGGALLAVAEVAVAGAPFEVAVVASDSSDTDAKGFLASFGFLFFCFRATTATLTSSKSSSVPFWRRFLLVPAPPASSTAIASPSFGLVLFDLLLLPLSSARGSTFHPVNFSMNREIISIAFLMGDGSDDDARMDFRTIWTELFEEEEEDAPPLVDSIACSDLGTAPHAAEHVISVEEEDPRRTSLPPHDVDVPPTRPAGGGRGREATNPEGRPISGEDRHPSPSSEHGRWRVDLRIETSALAATRDDDDDNDDAQEDDGDGDDDDGVDDIDDGE